MGSTLNPQSYMPFVSAGCATQTPTRTQLARSLWDPNLRAGRLNAIKV